MEENEKIGAQLTTCAELLRAARKGMPRKSIAGKVGMTVRQFNAVVEATPALEIALERAYADYDEEQRDGLTRVLGEAIEAKELSLQAKILRENQKELNERERENKIVQALESSGSFALIEPPYSAMSPERKAAIRAETEAMEALQASLGDSGDE